MEDDTHAWWNSTEESPVGPNDAPTPTADAVGRAEDPTLLTRLSAKLDRCLGRIDSLETELGTSKIIRGAIFTCISSKKLERTGLYVWHLKPLGLESTAVPSKGYRIA
ncbi:hypothetical protein Tco_1084792 [Tanacetum coccineum]